MKKLTINTAFLLVALFAFTQRIYTQNGLTIDDTQRNEWNADYLVDNRPNDYDSTDTQRKIIVDNQYAHSFRSPITLRTGTMVVVNSESSMYLINEPRMQFYRELHTLAKDTSQLDLMYSVLDRYEEFIESEQDIRDQLAEHYRRTGEIARKHVNDMKLQASDIETVIDNQMYLNTELHRTTNDLKKSIEESRKDRFKRTLRTSSIFGGIGLIIGLLVR